MIGGNARTRVLPSLLGGFSSVSVPEEPNFPQSTIKKTTIAIFFMEAGQHPIVNTHGFLIREEEHPGSVTQCGMVAVPPRTIGVFCSSVEASHCGCSCHPDHRSNK